jgi:hypothetical protein
MMVSFIRQWIKLNGAVGAAAAGVETAGEEDFVFNSASRMEASEAIELFGEARVMSSQSLAASAIFPSRSSIRAMANFAATSV